MEFHFFSDEFYEAHIFDSKKLALEVLKSKLGTGFYHIIEIYKVL